METMRTEPPVSATRIEVAYAYQEVSLSALKQTSFDLLGLARDDIDEALELARTKANGEWTSDPVYDQMLTSDHNIFIRGKRAFSYAVEP